MARLVTHCSALAYYLLIASTVGEFLGEDTPGQVSTGTTMSQDNVSPIGLFERR